MTVGRAWGETAGPTSGAGAAAERDAFFDNAKYVVEPRTEWDFRGTAGGEGRSRSAVGNA